MGLWPATWSDVWSRERLLSRPRRGRHPHFQYPLSTRAGTECACDSGNHSADPRATVLSVDGISAYHTISRVVSQFYGSPSTYLRENEEGGVHEIWQGEGGEQGDALMPALFSLGQHGTLEAIQTRLRPSEWLMASWTTLGVSVLQNAQRSGSMTGRHSCGTGLDKSQRGRKL